MPPQTNDSVEPDTEAKSTLFGVQVHKRNDLHLYRRFQHALTGVVILYIYWYVLGPVRSKVIFPAITIALVAWEMARLSFPALNELYVTLFKRLVRVEEKTRFTGAVLYMIGLSIVMLVSPPVIVSLATCYLSFGDPTAAIVGTMSPRTSWRQASTGKSWLGGAAAGVVNIIATLVLYAVMSSGGPHSLSLFHQVVLGVVSGGVAGVADMLVPAIDDNIVIPASTVLTAWPVLLLSGQTNLMVFV